MKPTNLIKRYSLIHRQLVLYQPYHPHLSWCPTSLVKLPLVFLLSLVYPQNAFIPRSVPILSLFFHNDVNASPSSDKNTHPQSFNAYQASTTVAKQRGPAILPAHAYSKRLGPVLEYTGRVCIKQYFRSVISRISTLCMDLQLSAWRVTRKGKVNGR